MLKNRDASIDYSEADVWERLSHRLTHDFEPRPSGSFGRVECEPGWSWRTRLPDYDFWFPVKGKGLLRLEGRSYAIRPGTLFFLRPGDNSMATQDPADPLTVIYIHLDFFIPGHQDPADMDGRWLPPRHAPLRDFARLDDLLTRAVRLMEQDNRLARFEAKLTLQQALLEAYRLDATRLGLAPARQDSRIERVVAYIRSHPAIRLSLEEAARMAQLSPGYFSRLFGQETGKSFREYTLEARLERSEYLLEETDMTISEVARALGYGEVFLFSRQFKGRYGYPPSKARKR
jgi:AraC family transcriptional regulator of arabinose operon